MLLKMKYKTSPRISEELVVLIEIALKKSTYPRALTFILLKYAMQLAVYIHFRSLYHNSLLVLLFKAKGFTAKIFNKLSRRDVRVSLSQK